MEKHNKCKDCLYFDDMFLACCKNAPTPQFSTFPKWPSVKPNNWCGEYRDARMCCGAAKEPMEV